MWPLANSQQIEGLPAGATLKPIESLPAGAELRPMQQGGGDSSTSSSPGMLDPHHDWTDPIRGAASGIAQFAEHPIDSMFGMSNLGGMPGVAFGPSGKMATSSNADAVEKNSESVRDAGSQAKMAAQDHPAFLAGQIAGPLLATYGMAKGVDALPETSEVPSMAGNLKRQILPSSARAGQRFESIMGQAKDIPVQMTNTVPELQRANELVERGGTALKPITDLTNRINMISPPTYGELRDYYPNMSRLSADEANKLKPTMRRQVGATSAAMNQDIRGALEPIGQADEYDKAMQEYGNAARNKSALKTAAKYGIAGAGLGVGGKILKDMIPDR